MVQVSLMANNASKNNTVDINVGQTKNIVVDPKVIAKIDINPEKIASITRDGNSAVIHLKDGTEIVLENFFISENPQILLNEGQIYWAANLAEDATGQTTVNYLEQNTRQFLQNLPANDVLLTGSRGTGKSSIVRALLTEYKDQGLRLIEIERDDLSDLPEIQKLIQKRPEKFIVYCDDLAFNAEDENYRSLKSVLDGSLQSGTSNFIIYATSNRRHLLPEFMHENTPVTRVDVPQYTELHPQEAIEEKISLSDRFGMWLSFYPMDQNLYLTIVEHYLAKTDMPMNDEAHAEALRWCQARGQRSGRAAYQFSKHWIGSQQLKAL
ncbi:ATP-binding protein [Acinetobacter baumannii]|nr:ATP-binding protein [Acinetobacter baumannii]EKX2574946.1 ATP-binding protein [Acinetobacter baumannii]EKX3077492.1 ATP-binding protein [Acinetobacter baumannii]